MAVAQIAQIATCGLSIIIGFAMLGLGGHIIKYANVHKNKEVPV